METIYKLIISDSETFAWAGGLFIVALFSYLLLVLPKFIKINKDINSILNKCNLNSIYSKDDILNLSDCKHPALKYALKETAKRFITIGPDKKPSFKSSPDDLWYFRGIFSKNFNYTLAEAAPNILVGLGLLLTFLFLTSALSQATVALMGNQNEQKDLLQATRGLLAAAGAKFLTSIAGLGSSILWTIALKIQSSNITRNLGEIYKKITENISVYGPEDLNLLQTELLAQNIEIQKEHHESNKNIIPVIQEVSFNIQKSLDQLGEKIGTMNQDALDSMLSNFANLIKTATKDEVEQMKKSLLELSERLEFAAQTIESGATGAGNALKECGDHLSLKITETGDLINVTLRSGVDRFKVGTDSFVATIHEVGQGLIEKSVLVTKELDSSFKSSSVYLELAGKVFKENILDASAGFGENIKVGSSQLSASVLNVTQAFEIVGADLIANAKVASKELDIGAQNSARHFSQAGAQFENYAVLAGDKFTDRIKLSTDLITEGSTEISKSMIEGSLGLLENSKLASNEFNRGTRIFSESILNVGDIFKSSITETVGQFNEKLKFGLDAQSKSIDDIANSINDINSSMHSLSALVKNAEKTGQSGFLKVQEIMINLDSLAGRFDASINRWQNSFDKVSEVSSALYDVADNLIKISDDQNKSISNFSNIIPSISLIVQEMNETINKTTFSNTEQIIQTETAIKSTRESLSKTVLTIQEGVQQYSEQIALLHRNLDEKIAEAINKISGGVDRLTGAIDDLDDSLEKISTK